MRIKKYAEDVTEQFVINGTHYLFMHSTTPGGIEVIARRWEGQRWITVHHWHGSK